VSCRIFRSFSFDWIWERTRKRLRWVVTAYRVIDSVRSQKEGELKERMDLSLYLIEDLGRNFVSDG